MTWAFPIARDYGAPGSWSVDQGVDITAPGGTPLLAVDNGTIVGHGIGGFGNDAPILKLDSGGYVYYGHAGPGNRLREGTHVQKGQVISEVGRGRVGYSTGPHLEIGFSDARGTPVGPKGNATAYRIRQLLLGADHTKVDLRIPAVGAVVAGSTAVNSLNAAGPSLPGIPSPGEIANAVIDALFGGIAKQGERAFLIAVMVLGGFVLAGYGLKRTAGGSVRA